MKKEFRVLEWKKGMPIQSHKVDGSGLHEDYEMDKTANIYNAFGITFVNQHLSHLSGEVFTILEASIDDERRLKATKDLVRNTFHKKMDWLYEQSGCLIDDNIPAEQK